MKVPPRTIILEDTRRVVSNARAGLRKVIGELGPVVKEARALAEEVSDIAGELSAIAELVGGKKHRKTPKALPAKKSGA